MGDTMLDTKTLYQLLYDHMGPQGWWPAESKIEVMLGAILVQNTNWRNAAYAIESLKQATHLEPHHTSNIAKSMHPLFLIHVECVALMSRVAK